MIGSLGIRMIMTTVGHIPLATTLYELVHMSLLDGRAFARRWISAWCRASGFCAGSLPRSPTSRTGSHTGCMSGASSPTTPLWLIVLRPCWWRLPYSHNAPAPPRYLSFGTAQAGFERRSLHGALLRCARPDEQRRDPRRRAAASRRRASRSRKAGCKARPMDRRRLTCTPMEFEKIGACQETRR
jgi:hypothetical protein